ncbi:MAG: DUF1848 domain-containing protein [Desulfitobacteriia bacterium]|jgi:DNA repair photolyase
MILSVSRRTDIPAFYSEWFFKRLIEGFVLVRNPMNYRQVSRVTINPEVVDCIVFWTKNPGQMLNKLDLLADYNYYFQITLTPYNRQIERYLPPMDELIANFKQLSYLIGKERTVWRYDPVILTNEMDMAYHIQNFETLARKLQGYTERCVISFLSLYEKTKRNMKGLKINLPTAEQKLEIGAMLANIALNYGFIIESCSETVDLSAVGIEPAQCIDQRLISRLSGRKLTIEKDRNQRDECGCATSIDIGAYNTCSHGCLYCYANYSDPAVENNLTRHNPESPMLIGNLEPEDRITDRKMVSYISISKQQILEFK